MPLFWRVFAINAAVLAAAAAALVLTPATVSFPVALTEALILALGLGALLALNFTLLRRAFRSLHALSAFMREVEPLRPGARAPLEDDSPEVAELTAAFNEMIDRLEEERRDSARRALKAQEDERRRVARDLHDEVGQRLTGVMLALAHEPRAREEVRAALEDVREIGRRLRPEALDDLGLAAALRSLVTDVERRTGMRADRDIGEHGPLTPEQELVAYRVAQEALTNAARHAGGAPVRVELRRLGEQTMLLVEDEGRGFDESPDGSGIRGMRERALLVGAHLVIESRRGRGTRVQLLVRDGPGR